MTLYIEKTKYSIKKLLEFINEYNKATKYKVDMQKKVASVYISNELAEKETKKAIPFAIAAKKNVWE
jgi:hypothetical protein